MSFTITFILVSLIIGLLVIPRLVTSWYSRGKTFSQVVSTPDSPVAIVFGAGLWRDGQPTPVLRDRVATAANLYFAGKVQKLLMSGGNHIESYNEPAAMKAYALELGVPEAAIVLDYAGQRTYDTCYRARDIFGIRRAILVTQGFHLPRALYTCNKLGIQGVGLLADRRIYRRFSMFYWNMREVPATLVALWEVHVSRPHPILGDPEPIFPMEAQ